ncbi:MAG: hypothetical protein K0S61_756 [Anaerocolumna sp.]|jgi:hypothetical protein|nr:hypothetical protein [Anaerocolumna sp.]
MEEEKKFTMYEYLDVNIIPNLAELCSDCYSELGWQVVNTNSGINSVALKLKRDRKIKNRTALYELQRNLEDALIMIERLEKLKLARPIGISLGIGLLGTALVALSVFAVTGYLSQLLAASAIPGFICWGAAYFLYKKLIKMSTAKINPMIDKYYDIIFEACGKAKQLLK